MALANYSDLTSAVADWMARDDLTDRIPDFIALAEATLNKVMRSPRMVTTASLAYTTNAVSAATPTDMIEPQFIVNASDVTNILEQCSVQQLIMLRRHRLKTAGTPKYFAIVGQTVQIAPKADTSYTMTIHYYQNIPSLQSNSTNWLMTYHPDLYLYATLMHTMPFLNDSARQQVLENSTAQMLKAHLDRNQIVAFDTKVPGFSLNSPADNATAAPVAAR